MAITATTLFNRTDRVTVCCVKNKEQKLSELTLKDLNYKK